MVVPPAENIACSDSEWVVTQQLFYDAAHNDILRRLPWLVLANCQDKGNARTEKQIRDDLHLDSVLTDRKWTLQLCSTSRISDARKGFEQLITLMMEPDETDKMGNNTVTQQPSPAATRL
ncbi:hypothetical protein NP493_404g02096 [Ridgeia piscesae]|uniref:Uncharacterized protein n=1 Tax=Ridgeia piscesae TaxID=27915 RepID=A0AAD9NVJ1_RIDPI|nr:hypothetical protein NP493_404g02096 [Ridgeia piscesae]